MRQFEAPASGHCDVRGLSKRLDNKAPCAVSAPVREHLEAVHDDVAEVWLGAGALEQVAAAVGCCIREDSCLVCTLDSECLANASRDAVSKQRGLVRVSQAEPSLLVGVYYVGLERAGASDYRRAELGVGSYAVGAHVEMTLRA